jgi:hypothetical protein
LPRVLNSSGFLDIIELMNIHNDRELSTQTFTTNSAPGQPTAAINHTETSYTELPRDRAELSSQLQDPNIRRQSNPTRQPQHITNAQMQATLGLSQDMMAALSQNGNNRRGRVIDFRDQHRDLYGDAGILPGVTQKDPVPEYALKPVNKNAPSEATFNLLEMAGVASRNHRGRYMPPAASCNPPGYPTAEKRAANPQPPSQDRPTTSR